MLLYDAEFTQVQTILQTQRPWSSLTREVFPHHFHRKEQKHWQGNKVTESKEKRAIHKDNLKGQSHQAFESQ